MLDAGDAQLPCNELAGAGNPGLLLRAELQIVILPGKVDLLASLGSAGGESQDGSRRAGFQGVEQDGC